METNQINTISPVLAKYRATAKEYGKFFGTQLFTIESTNPDLNWRREVSEDKNVLRKEVNVFLPKAVDIVSVSFLEKDLDSEPKIVLNAESNDPNLVFPLVKPEFTKATRASVTDCIERMGKKGSKPMFFAAEELPMLNELLRIHNQGVLTFYEELSRKFLKLSETVRNMITQSERMQSEYLRQCGVSNDETEVRMTVTLEEA